MVATSLYISLLPSVIFNGFGPNAQQVDPRSIPFLFGGVCPLNIYLIEPVHQSTSTFPFNIIPTTGLQLFFYLTDGTIGGAQYTWLVNWATDPANQYFIGNLPMSTAALQTLLGTGKSATASMQVSYIQNGLQCPAASFPVNIGVGAPTVGLNVPAGLTPLSAEAASATYFPIQPKPGQPLLLESLGESSSASPTWTTMTAAARLTCRTTSSTED